MKVRNANRNKDEKVEVQMTPMIDVVFMLLIYFLLTFNPIPPEGDFEIRMPPKGKPSDNLDDSTLLITISLQSDGKKLKKILWGVAGEGDEIWPLGSSSGGTDTIAGAQSGFNTLRRKMIKAMTRLAFPN